MKNSWKISSDEPVQVIDCIDLHPDPLCLHLEWKKEEKG